MDYVDIIKKVDNSIADFDAFCSSINSLMTQRENLDEKIRTLKIYKLEKLQEIGTARYVTDRYNKIRDLKEIVYPYLKQEYRWFETNSSYDILSEISILARVYTDDVSDKKLIEMPVTIILSTDIPDISARLILKSSGELVYRAKTIPDHDNPADISIYAKDHECQTPYKYKSEPESNMPGIYRRLPNEFLIYPLGWFGLKLKNHDMHATGADGYLHIKGIID